MPLSRSVTACFASKRRDHCRWGVGPESRRGSHDWSDAQHIEASFIVQQESASGREQRVKSLNCRLDLLRDIDYVRPPRELIVNNDSQGFSLWTLMYYLIFKGTQRKWCNALLSDEKGFALFRIKSNFSTTRPAGKRHKVSLPIWRNRAGDCDEE
jgi:hypothetical protein